MRTTIDLPRPLLDKAKAIAERDHLTLSQVVEAAVRDRVLRTKDPVSEAPFRLVAHGQGGLVTGFSWNRLKDVIEREDGVPKGVARARQRSRG